MSKDDVGELLETQNPIFKDRFKEDISAKDFFKGKSDSFLPFDKGMHFQRDQEDKILNRFHKSNTSIAIVSGPPGAGKTFLIRSVVERLVREQYALAMEILSSNPEPIPDSSKVKQFISAVDSETSKKGVDGPDSLVLFSTGYVEDRHLFKFEELQESIDIDIYLLFETSTGYSQPSGLKTVLEIFDINEKVSKEREEEFKDYIIDTTNSTKLESVSAPEVDAIYEDDNRFLPVMYRAVHPTKESVNQIINEERDSIESDVVSVLLEYVAVASSVEIDIPLPVCVKILNKFHGFDLSYQELEEDIREEGSSLINKSYDSRGTHYVSLYHSVVSGHICKTLNQDRIDQHLVRMAKATDLRLDLHANFAQELLIFKGSKKYPLSEVPYSVEALEKAFEAKKEEQPARPIIHHMAKFLFEIGKDSTVYLDLLKEAKQESDETYAMDEPVENILTTLADLTWKSKKESLKNRQYPNEEIEEIFRHLRKARSIESGLYSYTNQAKILAELASAKEGDEKMKIFNECLEVINSGLKKDADREGKRMLKEARVNIWQDIEENLEKAKEYADDLIRTEDDGRGYYILANAVYHEEKDYEQALEYLSTTLSAGSYPTGALALKIKILLELDSEDYDQLYDLAKELDRRGGYEGDWESVYHVASIYCINGDVDRADKKFEEAFRMAPDSAKYRADIHWMDGGSRKTFTGKVSEASSTRGFIYDHGIDGVRNRLFFDPRKKNTQKDLRSGMPVEFELGLSPKGPRAWDVRPQ
ncbi:hypothetical protein ACFQER_16160 [Halomicroarcula sp. GCM10025894]|uniref:hypothetical protein n=1 Tax=Halomicroarcula sp. GCM10025894 TaxID=3252673 RepID=UPI003621277B